MEEEINALRKNNTWEKCIIPSDKKAVGCKWVFTILNVMLMVQLKDIRPDLQQRGTHRPMGLITLRLFLLLLNFDTIRILFLIAANLDWPLHQFDVKNAFLHGEIEEEIYMELLPDSLTNLRRGKGVNLRRPYMDQINLVFLKLNRVSFIVIIKLQLGFRRTRFKMIVKNMQKQIATS